MKLTRKQAATIIDVAMLRLAELKETGVINPDVWKALDKLEEVFTDHELKLPRRCPGEAHTNANIDGCATCLDSISWGWTHEETKVR